MPSFQSPQPISGNCRRRDPSKASAHAALTTVPMYGLAKIKNEMSCGLLSEQADFKAAADLIIRMDFPIDTSLW